MADPRERIDDWLEVLHTIIDRRLSSVWTSMPVKILEDSDGNTVKLQPTIQGKQPQQDGTTKDVDITYSGKCPVQFASGGGFTITHPIKKNDEGVAVYAARNIDNWWAKGTANGLQPQFNLRRHNLSDAIYVPGVRSKPRQLGGDGSATERASKGTPPSTTSLQIRSDDGSWYIEVAPNAVINIVTPSGSGSVNITTQNATVTASQNVTVTSQNVTVTAKGKVHVATPLLEVTGDIHAGGDIQAGASVSSMFEADPLSGVGGIPSTPGAVIGAALNTAEQAIGTWQAITNGSFQVPINNIVQQVTGLNFAAVQNLSDVAHTITGALTGSMSWNAASQLFSLASNTVGINSAVGFLSAIPGIGHDISGLLKMTANIPGVRIVAGVRGTVSLLEHLHQMVMSGGSRTGDPT